MENQLLLTLSRNKLLKNADISKIDLRNVKGRLITIGEGEILYREGDVADIIYLVISGEINVLKKRLLGKTKSYIFSENDFFGHEEFFEETSRTSTAVALRDSYLISLNREEIDLLIKQDDEILMNLREPVAQLDEEILTRKDQEAQLKSSTSEEETIKEKQQTIQPAYPAGRPAYPAGGPAYRTGGPAYPAGRTESRIPPVVEPEQLKYTESELKEFFKSIADTSRANDENLVQPLAEPGLERDEIPTQPMERFAPQEWEPTTKSSGEEEPQPGYRSGRPAVKPAFDESTFLNEDGIPKAEFELPDVSSAQKREEKKTDEDLNDALFKILSGNDTTISERTIEEQPIKEKDGPPLADFFDAEFTQEPTDEKKFFAQEYLPKKEESEFELTTPGLVDQEHFIQKQQDEKEDAIPTTHKEVMNVDELQMIIKAAGLVNSNIRIDEVLKNIVDVAVDLTDADRGTLYLVDKEKNELWSLIAMGDETHEIRLRIGEGLAGFVARRGETINIKDVQRDPRFRADFDKSSGYTTKNMICFPIKNNKGEIIGVLQLLNSGKGEFTKRDEEFLNALSIHSAIALQNADLVEKLLQTERVQSLGKMANFLIQDIKKPILVSKRYAEHLRSKPLTPDTIQIVDMLLEQLGQVADIVQTTSSYSEEKPLLRTMNVSLNSTLTNYASRLEQYVDSRNCQIQSEYDKDVTVKLDVKEFFQCYMHIVKNACDAMPEGGNIHILTKHTDKKIEIYFKDNGLGIPEGFKDKIFEPFMTYGKKEGTGLGLPITKKIVEAHNGAIRVESSIGEGAAFIISLPVTSSF
ncbi:MAG: ATP-binding protein [Bacteroidota bacterium]